MAHEALLRRWHRVIQWIDAHRDFLRVRDQVVQRMGQGGVLLAGDPLFDLARVELTAHRSLFTSEQITFIENAIAAAERKQQRSRRIRNTVMASLAALTLVALVAMGWALKSEKTAIAHKQTAEQKTADAERELEQARHNMGLAYILRAEQEIANKSYNGARLFALHALSNLKQEAHHKANSLIGNHPIYPVIFSSPSAAHHKGDVASVSYSPDGKTLASGGRDKTIKLWDLATGKETATLTGHSWYVTSVSYSPDGKTLASGSGDNTIKLWDVAMGKEKATLEGHLGDVASVSYSPDGKTLASGSWDNTIKLWDVATGKEKVTLTGHSSIVNSVSYSPDGKTLASGSGDLGNGGNTVRLWDVAFLSDTEPIESIIKQAEYSFHLSVAGFDLVTVESTPTNLYHNAIIPPQWPITHPFHWLSRVEAGDAEAMVELGIVYDRNNNFENAHYWYEKAIFAGSDWGKERMAVFMPWFTLNRLQTQWEKSDWQAVIETCTAWIELNPENADAYWNRGHAFFKQGQYAPAEADCRKVMELVPDFGDAQGILAWVLILQGRFSDALAPAQKANALAPESYELAINLGHVHLMLGDAREAESQYVKTIPLLPDEAALQAGPLADFDIFIKNGWQPEACRKWRQWFVEAFARHKAG